MAANTSDGSVVLSVDMNIGQAEKKLNKLTSDIEKQENKIREITQKRDEAQNKGVLDAAALDAEKAKLEELKSSLADLKAMAKDKGTSVEDKDLLRGSYIPEAQQAFSDQQARVRALQAEYNLTENSVARYNVQLKQANNALAVQQTEAGTLATQIDKANSPAAQFGKRIREAGDGVDHLQNRIKRLATRVMIFSVFTMALRGMRQWIGNVVKGNDEARKSIAQLKGALLTLVQPLVSVIIPAFIKLVNVLSQIVNSIAKLVSNIFGTTAEKSAEAAKKLNDEQKALKGVGGAAKKASKQVASFDEINQVGENNVSGGGGATSTEISPDFSQTISDTATTILTDLGLLVIGALLTFTGAHVLLGIGMMALGAYGLYKEITENPGAVKEALNGWLGGVLVLVGIAALTIGAILAFSGANISLGIALMVIGAGTLIAMATLAPDKMSEMLSGWIGEALVIAGIVAFIIGVLLAFSGSNIPLGIGLMLLGGAAVATEAMFAPDMMKELLSGWVGEALVIVGIFALTLGVVLAFSGLKISLGIGLIILGASAMFAEATLAPDAFKEMLNGWLGTVLVIVGMIALVVGVVLAFSGVNIFLGIGLIALGAAALIAKATLAPDAMKEMLNDWLGTALVIGGIIAVVIGIILICTGAGLPLGIALLVLGIGMLYAGIAPNWDFILETLKGIWDNIKNWWDTYIAKYFTFDFWKGLAKDMLDGLFKGLGAIGDKIKSWGEGFIGGVKDFFGIHSPSTEFADLGGYMMAGLKNGVDDDTQMVESVFDVMFTSITAKGYQCSTSLQDAFSMFMLYLIQGFSQGWVSSWKSFQSGAYSGIEVVKSAIDSLNAKLASIERNIMIKITTVYDSVGKAPSSSSMVGIPSGRIANAPAITTIPKLATGGVIPPNREFMAVLGDQKRGYNVEAPADLIRQIVREEVASAGVGRGEDIKIVFNGDLAALARVLNPHIEREKARIGTSFVNGGMGFA